MERGYVRRVATFIAVILMVICSGLSILAMTGKLVFRADGKNEFPEEWDIMEKHLYLCDCPNCSTRIDPDFHTSYCGYYKWYVQWTSTYGKEA